MTEKELVEGVVQKQETAFKELVQMYQKQVIGTCFSFLGNYEDAQDIAQEVFIEVYESIEKFRKESKLSTWIYRIAVNKSLNYRKVVSRRQWIRSIESFFGKDSNETHKVIANQSDNPGSNIENEERKIILQKAINKLPESQRIAFTLNKYDELSYQQVAEVMQTSLSSVESLIHRAKTNLQKHLINYYN